MSDEVFPSEGGGDVPNGPERLPSGKKEERDPLTTVLRLAPLLSLILQFLELLLKISGVIK